jgi:predicted transcriptional regulator
MPEDATLNENAEKIVAYLNEVAGQNVTLDDVAAAVELDKRVVNGSFNALVKKGICARTPATIEAPATVKYLTLTEEGLGYTE